MIGERTRLVAVTAASNAIGSRPDVRAIADRAHAAGALVYVDGVHATPHVPTDMRALGADFYVFSTYKLFGPHAGALVADPALLERMDPAKLAPAADDVPDRFERGTPAFELLAGITAVVDWLAGLTDAAGSRRERLTAALTAVEAYLAGLLREALAGLAAIDRVRVLPAPPRRTSTLSFVVDGHHAAGRRRASGAAAGVGLGRRQLRLRADGPLRAQATPAARCGRAWCSTTPPPTCRGCSTPSPSSRSPRCASLATSACGTTTTLTLTGRAELVAPPAQSS